MATGLSLVNSAAASDPGFLKIVISSPQHQGLAFAVTVTVHLTDGNQALTFNGPLTLTAHAPDGPVVLIGGDGLSITNGFWAGTVSTLTSGTAFTLHGETSGGLTGTSLPFNVLPLQLRSVSLLAEDMVYDPTRHRIFASVGSSVPVYSNSVVRLDPESGQIEAAVSVGQITTPSVQVPYHDGKVALSDNGQFLYVAYIHSVINKYACQATAHNFLSGSFGCFQYWN